MKFMPLVRVVLYDFEVDGRWAYWLVGTYQVDAANSLSVGQRISEN